VNVVVVFITWCVDAVVVFITSCLDAIISSALGVVEIRKSQLLHHGRRRASISLPESFSQVLSICPPVPAPAPLVPIVVLSPSSCQTRSLLSCPPYFFLCQLCYLLLFLLDLLLLLLLLLLILLILTITIMILVLFLLFH
jgi:hypothetical protein